MKHRLSSVIWRLGVFSLVCVLGIFALFAIFAQLRFQHTGTFKAVFTSVAGLEGGSFVRVAGVEVGKVKDITIDSDARAVVEFSVGDNVVLTEASRARIRFENVVGDRYLALEQGAGSIVPLARDAVIPVERTTPAVDLDALIGGFRPLLRAMDPDQVNALSGQLVQIFDGQGASIDSFLSQLASFTITVADRDRLIGDVITNLRIVVGSVADQSGQLDKTVESLTALIGELNTRRTDVSAAVANTSNAAETVADLLAESRAPFQKTIEETDRSAAIVVSDHEYFDDLLNTLPQAYQALARQGLSGDFFSFYLCDVVLKVNGKGGQPVHIKVAGQASGRCQPK